MPTVCHGLSAWPLGSMVSAPKKQPGIVSCSALKRSYRQIIIGDRPEVRLVLICAAVGT